MKLRNILEDIIVINNNDINEKMGNLDSSNVKLSNFDNISLGPKELRKFKDLILSTEEFKDVDNLIIVDTPLVCDNSGKSYKVESMVFKDDLKLSGTVVLYNVGLSPEINDPNRVGAIFNEFGIVMTPTQYNPINFKASKTVKFSVDIDQTDVDEIREGLHDKVDELMDNLDVYTPTPTRELIMRGLFERVEYDGEVGVNEYVKDIDINATPTHFMVFYLESNEGGSVASIDLKERLIPIELKDKWLRHTSELSLMYITSDMIDSFIAGV